MKLGIVFFRLLSKNQEISDDLSDDAALHDLFVYLCKFLIFTVEHLSFCRISFFLSHFIFVEIYHLIFLPVVLKQRYVNFLESRNIKAGGARCDIKSYIAYFYCCSKKKAFNAF